MADTTEKTVAEELRAAARKLRDLAAKAPEGPWSWDGPIWGAGPDGPDTSTLIVTDPKRETVVLLPFAHEPFRHPRAEEAAPWIRMMSPVVAEPLASWLESEAEWLDTLPAHNRSAAIESGMLTPALAVARVLNGTTERTGS